MARTAKTRVKKELKDKRVSDKSVVIKKSEPKIKIKSEPKSVTKRKPKKEAKTKLFYGSDIVSILSSTPSEVSVSVSSKPKRRKSNTDPKLFTQKEKKLFYECLKENGFSCLNDESILSQIFANRSIAEINAMIDGFSRKAQDLNRKNEENFSNIESDPNACKQPLEKWSDLIHQMVPNPSKKDDMSAILIDCFDHYISPVFAQQSDSDIQTLRPDYRAIYECIIGAMNGKYAKQMDPINALVIIKLIEELKQLIKSGLNKDEMTFLESGIWWQIPNETNARKTGDDLFRAIYSQRQQQNGIQLSENTDISNENEIQSQSDNHSNDDIRDESNEDNEETIYENYKTFPKLRKIIECLNPLRVPIELTSNEYNRW